MNLPKLKHDDYLQKGYDFWKNFRQVITKLLSEENIKLDKTPNNIVDMAIKSGIKPTARYFNISPSQVRYYINKRNNTKS